MFDLDKLISEAYDEAPMSFEKLAEMVEDILVLQESLGILNEETGPQAPNVIPQKVTFELIPIPPISELAWGDPGSAASVPSNDYARSMLANYLRNIKGNNLKDKLREVKNFLDNPEKYVNELKTATEDGQQAASINDKIRVATSILVFYKTLTTIITNFNASAAGFIFESFLAVLLDAEAGRQIPAAGASTIADFVVTGKNNDGRYMPISLKLYSAGGLKVGGSFKQIVNDLYGASKSGIEGVEMQQNIMQYVVVTKELKSESPSLQFYVFNLTRENLPILLQNNKELFQVPNVFLNTRAYNNQIRKGEETFRDSLMIPKAKNIDYTPYVEGGQVKTGARKKVKVTGFKPEMKKFFKQKVALSDTEVASTMADALYNIFDQKFKEIYGESAPYDKTGVVFLKSGGKKVGHILLITQEIADAITNKLKEMRENKLKEDEIRAQFDDWKADNPNGEEHEYFMLQTPEGKPIFPLYVEINNMLLNVFGLGTTKSGNPKLTNNSPFKAAFINAYDLAKDISDKTKPKQTPRDLKIKELDFKNGFDLIKTLSGEKDPKSRERLKLALMHSSGYSFNRQFEMSETQMKKNSAAAQAIDNNTLPYDGKIDIGQLSIGKNAITSNLNGVIAGLNKDIFKVFDDLRSLVINLNQYVASGLSDESAQREGRQAVENATDISTGTARTINK